MGSQLGEEEKSPGEQWIEEDIEEEDPAELAHHRMMKEDLNHVLLTLSEVRMGRATSLLLGGGGGVLCRAGCAAANCSCSARCRYQWAAC